MLKQVLYLSFLFVFPVLLFAQQQKDTVLLKDTTINTASATNGKPDTLITKMDTTGVLNPDSVDKSIGNPSIILQQLLKENRFLNFTGKPVAIANQYKKRKPTDVFFYFLIAIAALFGLFRFFYPRYFNNLFRVFFNSSLRQSQLTDQLLQDKLPSLLFNILFALSGGAYIYFLFIQYRWILPGNFWPTVIYCTLGLGLIYLVKFLSLKFTGWVTSYKEITNTYVFIIFLINKILGVLLIPFTVVMAFSMPTLVNVAATVSLLLIGSMFILRFFRSYGLLQNKIKVSGFHFVMFVAAVEIVPVLLIYKGLILLLSKNL